MLKLYFGIFADHKKLVQYIAEFRDTHWKDLQMLKSFQDELKQIPDEHNHSYILKIIDLGIQMNEAYVSWSKETIHQLKENSNE